MSDSPGWIWISYVAGNDFELLILLPLLPGCLDSGEPLHLEDSFLKLKHCLWRRCPILFWKGGSILTKGMWPPLTWCQVKLGGQEARWLSRDCRMPDLAWKMIVGGSKLQGGRPVRGPGMIWNGKQGCWGNLGILRGADACYPTDTGPRCSKGAWAGEYQADSTGLLRKDAGFSTHTDKCAWVLARKL